MKPKVALVLGSGLGEFAKTVKPVAEIRYSEIEGFPVSTVAGHDGRRVAYHSGYQSVFYLLLLPCSHPYDAAAWR